MDNISQLYPLPSQERPLKGTYLDHQLRQYGQNTKQAFVYANFVTSLDGRIAIPHPTRPGLMVPKNNVEPIMRHSRFETFRVLEETFLRKDWAIA